jgi:hypothetical protein
MSHAVPYEPDCSNARLTSAHRGRLLKRIQADLEQMARCAQGEHQMEATRSPGLFVCTFCRTVGVCPWCGLILPDGACLYVCPQHRATVAQQAAQTNVPEGGEQ